MIHNLTVIFSKSKQTLNSRAKKPRIPSTKFNAKMDGHHIKMADTLRF